MALQEQRTPASEDQIAQIIHFMQSKGLPDASGAKAEGSISAYRIALKGVSKTAVRQAGLNFIAGTVERSSHSFMPNAPEFANEARRIDRMIASDMARLRDEQRTIQDQIEYRAKPKYSEESLQRVRDLHRMLKAQYEQQKQREEALTSNEDDEERKERLKAILALPVRHNASREELNHAARMAAKLNEA